MKASTNPSIPFLYFFVSKTRSSRKVKFPECVLSNHQPLSNRNDSPHFSLPPSFVEWDIVLSQKFRNVFSWYPNACELFFAIFAKISNGSSHTHTAPHTNIYGIQKLVVLVLSLVVMGTTRTWILDVHRRHLFWNAHIMTFEGTQSGNKLRQQGTNGGVALGTLYKMRRIA